MQRGDIVDAYARLFGAAFCGTVTPLFKASSGDDVTIP
jgi:hypothetical protein